jgi:hypothetical protein
VVRNQQGRIVAVDVARAGALPLRLAFNRGAGPAGVAGDEAVRRRVQALGSGFQQFA